MKGLTTLPLAVPLLIAAVMVGASPVLGRYRQLRDLLAILSLAVTTTLAALLVWHSRVAPSVYWFGGWQPRDGKALGISFLIDPISAGLATLAAFLATAALVYSWHYFDEVRGLFHALMAIFTAGMIGFSLTGDLFNLFVFFELMGVAAFGLTCYNREEPTLEGALNFAVTNSIGAFLILLGIGLIYARTSALDLAEIGNVLVEQVGAGGGVMAPTSNSGSGAASEPLAANTIAGPHHSPDGLALVSISLLFAGFLIKAAAVPFHFWLADAHAVAPTPVSVLFSGVMVQLGLYALARIYWSSYSGIFPPEAGLRPILVALGAGTAIFGALMCLLQRHLKRLLAFSTISHSGVILIAIGLFTPAALNGAVIYIFAHGLIKASLFMVVGILLHRLGSVDEFELHGRGRELPWTGALFMIGGLALAGAPPFGLFTGKALIEEAAAAAGNGWITTVAVFASILTGGAVLRAAGRIFLGLGLPKGLEASAPVEIPKPETHGARNMTPAVMAAPIVVLLTAALLLGTVPSIPGFFETAAINFQDRGTLADLALHDATIPLLTRGPGRLEIYTAATTLFGIVSTLGAIALAATLIHYDLSAMPGPIGRLLDRGSKALENLHSGHVGDYIAWITIGTAILGGVVGATLGAAI